MKIKFNKKAPGYKIDQEIDIADEAVAKEFISEGFAVEVKAVENKDKDNKEVEVGDIAAKAADDLLTAVDAKIAAMEKKVAKAFTDRKPSITVGSDRAEQDPTHGFKSFGEFAVALRSIGTGGVDNRLKGLMVNKAGSPTDSGAATADGGALIPVGFSSQVIDAVAASSPLFPYLDAMPVTGRTMTVPVVKHYDFSNTTNTNGVVASYATEASDVTISKEQWELLSLSLKTLVALCPTTEQLEEDAGVALGSYLTNEGARQINETITKNILRDVTGGVTSLLGNGSTLHASVLAVTRKDASKVEAPDVLAIFQYFYGDMSKAVWIMHPTVVGQLGNMTSGTQNIYMPAGFGPNSSNAPFGSLLGRPIIISQYASKLGSKGDIGLYDLSKVQAIYRAGGINMAMSMHLYFASLQNAYRFVYRWDAKPKLTTTITLQDGTTTVSPFVVLSDAYGA